MDGHVPVSYTHLDVYKRQTYAWCGPDHKDMIEIISDNKFTTDPWNNKTNSLFLVYFTVRVASGNDKRITLFQHIHANFVNAKQLIIL